MEGEHRVRARRVHVRARRRRRPPPRAVRNVAEDVVVALGGAPREAGRVRAERRRLTEAEQLAAVE